MIFNTNEGPGMRRPAEVIPPMPTSGPSVGASPTPPQTYYNPPPPRAVPNGAVPVQGGGYQYPTHPQQQQYGQQGYPMMQQQQVVVQQKRGVNHGLHLVLTLITFGLWLPVWILDCLFNA